MIDRRYQGITARIVFGKALAADSDADVNTQLAARMNQLITDPPSDWTPLSRRTSGSLTTTAA
jgi:hypothetical protein